MGLNNLKICLDSCLAIYLIEENPDYEAILKQKLLFVTGATLCASDLLQMETLVIPLRLKAQPAH